MTKAELVALLLDRIRAAQAASKLGDLLRDIKETQKLPRDSFRISGTVDQLAESAQTAAAEGWLSEDRLAALVDDVEENGGQHIFLFDLTPDGKKALAASVLDKHFTAMPLKPTPGMYAELPSATRTYFQERKDAIVVKQVFTGSYWERDDRRSYSHDDERATFMVRKARRAINLLRIQPEQGFAEIRVDRIRGQMDDTLALELLKGFIEDLAPVLESGRDLINVPVWDALSKLAKNRTEIYLNADDADDPEAHIRFHNRRARDRGADIRDHAKYPMKGDDIARDSLSPYWIIDGDTKHKVFTNLAIIEKSAVGRCGKIYVSATLEPKKLAHILDRIRHVARPTS